VGLRARHSGPAPGTGRRRWPAAKTGGLRRSAESARPAATLDGQALAGVFRVGLRPNDLVWNYVINKLPARQEAARRSTSSTGTRTAVRLAGGACTADFSCASRSTHSIVRPWGPRGARLAGRPGRRSTVEQLTSVAGANDPHRPVAQNALPQARSLLRRREALRAVGPAAHIPGAGQPRPRRSRRGELSDRRRSIPSEPRRVSSSRRPKLAGQAGGPTYVEWLAQRSGEMKPAPKKLGSRVPTPAHGKAPGSLRLRGLTDMATVPYEHPRRRAGATDYFFVREQFHRRAVGALPCVRGASVDEEVLPVIKRLLGGARSWRCRCSPGWASWALCRRRHRRLYGLARG